MNNKFQEILKKRRKEKQVYWCILLQHGHLSSDMGKKWICHIKEREKGNLYVKKKFFLKDLCDFLMHV